MSSQDTEEKQVSRFLPKKIKIALIAITSSLSLYALLGFLVLPAVLKDQVPKIVKEGTQRNITIAEIQFNPFSLEFTLDALQLSNLDNTSFISFNKFYINIAVLRSLYELSLQIDEVLLDSPHIAIARNKDGSFNFSDLKKPAEAEAKPETPIEEDQELFPVSITKITLNKGGVSWQDKTKSAEHKADIHPLNLNISNFTTQVNKDSQLSIALTFASGGQLNWQGKVKLKPFESEGHIELNYIKLNKVWKLFLEDSVNFAILEGQENLIADYYFSNNNDKTQLLLSNTEIGVTGLKIAKEVNQDAVINIGDFKLSGISLDLLKQSVKVQQLASNDANFKAWLNADGSINYQALFAPKNSAPATEASTVPETSTASKPWDVLIEEVNFNNYSVNFTDKSVSPAAHINLTNINLHLSQLSNQKQAKLPFDLGLNFNKSGKIKLDGHAVVEPLSSNVNLAINDIALKEFQPYVNKFARLNIISGLFNLKANIDVQQAADKPIALVFKGDSHINRLITRDKKSNNDFLKWKSLNINRINADTAANSYSVNTIKLDQLYSRVLIRKDKSMNVNDILIQSKTKKTEPKKKVAKAGKPIKYKVNKVIIANSSTDFSDLSLILPFSAHITQLKGSVKGISSKKNAEFDINLDGKVANLSPVIIKGLITPSLGNSNVELNFNSMPLPLVTPYMAEFAGRKIEKGNMTLGLKYDIKDKKLNASNNLLIEKLVLGEEVENPDAVSLPLGLAIALLEDSDGNITLDVPITGDLENPEFSVSALVFDAFVNVLTKIISSPFNAIASLMGSDEDMSQISFTAGEFQLADTQHAKLDSLVTALSSRPMLKLEIKGTAFSKQDWPPLQVEALRLQLTELKVAELNKKSDKKVLVEHVTLSDEEYNEQLATLFIQKFPTLGKRSLFGTPKLIEPTQGDFYVLAKDKLSKLIPPNPQRLHKLAKTRAQSIAKYLIDNKIELNRIFLLDMDIDPTDPELDNLSTKLSLTTK